MKLRGKLLAVCLPTAAAAIMMAAGLSAYGTRQVIIHDFAERRLMACRQFLPQARVALDERGEAALLRTLLGALETLGADSLAITSPNGVILAHTDVTRRGLRLDIHPGWRALPDRRLQVLLPIRPDSGDEYMLTAGTSSPALGYLAATFTLAADTAAERRVLALLVLVVVLSVASTLAAAFWLLGRLLAPVEGLARAVEELAGGRYGMQVPQDSDDEVGDLARRFNQLSAELQRSVVSKARLEEATDFLDSVIETLPLMVFVKDAQTLRFVKFNAAGESILGRKRQELLGKSDYDLLPAESAAHFAEQDRRVLERFYPVDFPEETLRSPEGERVLHTIKTSIRGRDGKPLYLLGISEDITERKRAEENLRHAEKLSTLGQLSAGVAHEINNPLSVILGFARAAGKRLPEEHELSLPLSVIERETQRCLRVVKDLLTFSRRTQPAFEVFDLGDTVEATRFILEARAVAKTIRLITSVDAVRCRGDRHLLEQVVLNLVNNAVDAAPAGSSVSIRVRSDRKAGHAAIEVEDEGPGIPAEIRTRVLEPFFTTKEVGQGTGLGLSLVHEIASKHGGRVEIGDGSQGGALVRLILPLQETAK